MLVLNRPDCCLDQFPNLHVTLRNRKEFALANCDVYDWRTEYKRLMMCEPSIEATSVTISAHDVASLTLCEVLVTATGKVFFYSLGSKELELREEKSEYTFLLYLSEKTHLG